MPCIRYYKGTSTNFFICLNCLHPFPNSKMIKAGNDEFCSLECLDEFTLKLSENQTNTIDEMYLNIERENNE